MKISDKAVYNRKSLNESKVFILGLAAMPFPLWCPFDIEDDSLA